MRSGGPATDVLIGVQNNSSAPLASIALTGKEAFGFDGDGMCNSADSVPPLVPSGCLTPSGSHACGGLEGGCFTTSLVLTQTAGGVIGRVLYLPAGVRVQTSTQLLGGAASPTGTIAFSLFHNAACSGPSIAAGLRAVPAASFVSAAVLMHRAGTYYWQARYSGNATSAASVSTCGSQVAVVESGEHELPTTPSQAEAASAADTEDGRSCPYVERDLRNATGFDTQTAETSPLGANEGFRFRTPRT